jgi:hypothetical protein
VDENSQRIGERTGGYRPETDMSGKSLRGRPGPTQRSRASDDDGGGGDNDYDDDDDDDDDMWRKVKT